MRPWRAVYCLADGLLCLLLLCPLIVSQIQSALTPCSFPRPRSAHFHQFCQRAYHGLPYVCDPVSTFSRTEMELIDRALRHNFTSCFCDDDDLAACSKQKKQQKQGQYSVALVVIPLATLQMEQTNRIGCSWQMPLHSLKEASLTYVSSLAKQWDSPDRCTSDLMLAVILGWQHYEYEDPLLVPYYRFALEHLSPFRNMSAPRFLQRHERPSTAMLNYVHTLRDVLARKRFIPGTNQLFNGGKSTWSDDMSARAIPLWAVGLGVGLLLLAFVSIALAHCLTTYSMRPQWVRSGSSVSIRMANQRWAAGFGGGLMATKTPPLKGNMRSSMMFRSFANRQRAGVHASAI